MTLDDVLRLMRPLTTRVANVVGRGVVLAVDASTKLQTVQVECLPGEIRDAVEHFEGYGMTARPLVGAEVVIVSLNGRREHAIALDAADRRYRPRDLVAGEVAVYNHTGAKVVMKVNGDIVLVPGEGGKIRLSADTEVSGTLRASTDVVANGTSLHTHRHVVQGANSAGPVVFVPPGQTGTP